MYVVLSKKRNIKKQCSRGRNLQEKSLMVDWHEIFVDWNRSADESLKNVGLVSTIIFFRLFSTDFNEE
jgi:hypothetical protein